MEKIILKTQSEIQKAIDYFGEENQQLIIGEIKSYPCVLIGAYSEDVEFGNGYDFIAVYPGDFEQ